MAAIFLSNDASALLKAFRAEIDNGKIKTWKYDDDGDFYHTDAQFKGKAWFKPKTETGKLSFFILKSKTENISVFVYAYYHGHIIETMLYHFDSSFSMASATAQPATGDVVK